MSQRTSVETTLIYSRIVDRYAHFFDRPEVRLRFLNNTLAKQAANRAKLEQALQRFDFFKQTKFYEQLLELLLYRLIFRELRQLLPSTAKQRLRLLRQNKAPLAARVFFGFYQVRHVFYGMGITLVTLMLFGLYSGVVWSAQRINGYLAQRYQIHKRAEDKVDVRGAELEQAAIKYLPDYRPEKVWLVEQKDDHERYSNGGRILTDYETANHARGYYALRRGGGAVEGRLRREPVGIVYHTSESDLIPFTPDNNDSIETRTRGLLEYVRRNKSYNYLIDRFGQIYRIVRDDHAANHAGHSVWADQQNVYVGLNESFLGVCFETNSEAGTLDEQLTEAQLVAGRLLTQILRSRYNIDDADCVTHGLVSVNPSNMLICYHHDWVRNFPFEAMGLSDKYKVAPASISEFGFTYDEGTINKIGGSIWPGAKIAQEEFKRRAEEAKVRPQEMRRLMRDRYREQMELTRRLRHSARDGAEVSRAATGTSLAQSLSSSRHRNSDVKV
ncbi:MAG TPA: peptidoglycan recognition family protein [Pyrinomonadaceae bacterium]|nr:peptidoglycan recognition family protein [Pyrinomonadaceae bacterium]